MIADIYGDLELGQVARGSCLKALPWNAGGMTMHFAHMLSRLAASLVLVVIFAPCAGAQYSSPIIKKSPPPQRPAISPYVNLLRRNNSPAFNYFTLVRPEIDFRNQLQQQGAQLSQLRGQLDTQRAATPQQQQGPTGHATSFLNYSHYYPGISRRTGGPGR